MSQRTDSAIAPEAVAPKLADGVLDLNTVPGEWVAGCRVFIHYNGPTDQLSVMCTGMAVLDVGASPHEPHRHPEEEFLIVSEGNGEIYCGDETTQVGPGAIMYCAGNVLHGIKNTGKVPMTFYWSKWQAKSAQ